MTLVTLAKDCNFTIFYLLTYAVYVCVRCVCFGLKSGSVLDCPIHYFGFLITFFFTGWGCQPQAKLLFCQGYHTLVKNAQFQGVKFLPPPNTKAQRDSKDIALLFL